MIGKDVPDALLRAVADRAEDDLHRRLAALQAAEFLYEASLFPELEYTFKHALTHEVAYGSLLQERRKALHARVVEAIERLHADRLAEHVERLAHHALRAERWPEAIDYARSAGRKALGRSAYREALSWFEQALDGLRGLPESRTTQELGLDLRLELHIALASLAMYGRALEYMREAVEIVGALGDRRRQAGVYAAMSDCLRYLGRYDEAVTVGQHALQLAEDAGDQAAYAYAMYQLAQAYRARGELRPAVDALRLCLDAPSTAAEPRYFELRRTILLFIRPILAWTLGELGDFDEAVTHGMDGVRICEESGDPSSVVQARNTLARAYLERGDVERAVPLLEGALDVGRTSAAVDIFIWSLALRGVAHTLAGQTAQAVSFLEDGVGMADANGIVSNHALWSTWLGEAYLATGRIADARRTIEDALARATAQQERAYRADALRALGTLAAREEPPAVEEAEQCYREALTLAEELEMRPLQAHCHLGLGKLYRRIGRVDEARAELVDRRHDAPRDGDDVLAAGGGGGVGAGGCGSVTGARWLTIGCGPTWSLAEDVPEGDERHRPCRGCMLSWRRRAAGQGGRVGGSQPSSVTVPRERERGRRSSRASGGRRGRGRLPRLPPRGAGRRATPPVAPN